MFDGNGALRHAGLCEHLDFTGREQPSYVDKKGCNMIQRYKLNINGTYRCIWHREDDIRLPQNEGCTHIYRDEPQYIYIYILSFEQEGWWCWTISIWQIQLFQEKLNDRTTHQELPHRLYFCSLKNRYSKTWMPSNAHMLHWNVRKPVGEDLWFQT